MGELHRPLKKCTKEDSGGQCTYLWVETMPAMRRATTGVGDEARRVSHLDRAQRAKSRSRTGAAAKAAACPMGRECSCDSILMRAPMAAAIYTVAHWHDAVACLSRLGSKYVADDANWWCETVLMNDETNVLGTHATMITSGNLRSLPSMRTDRPCRSAHLH
eukprot:6206799-Pleurochrysis_carterae.AAC.2